MTKEERLAEEERVAKNIMRFGGVICAEESRKYDERISDHLMQEPKDAEFDGSGKSDVLAINEGNVRMFGRIEEKVPLVRGGAWCIETPFTIWSEASKGKIREKYVTLRTWSDQDLTRSIDLNIKMVTLAMDKARPSSDMKFEIVTNTVICWLRLRGQFFWLLRDNCDTIDPDMSMFFDNKEQKLKLISSPDFKTWLHAHSGISPANQRMWKQVIEGIKTTSTNPQISRGVKPGNLFDRRGDVIYISCGPSYMVRVSAEGVKLVENGTDGVVFALGRTLAKWELLAESEGRNPFVETQVFGNANYASEHGRTILMMWFLALAACIKNYPIILFQGRYRSGKTRCAQAMMELLGIPVKLNSVQDNGQEDFWALLNAGGVTCFDNVDGRIVKWFPNDIQIASTGGSKTKRKMYTDAETVELGANAKLMLTANDPKFMSDSGISDRILNVELLPFAAGNKKDSEDSKLTEEIVGIRSSAFTWMAYTLSHALADSSDVRKNLNKRHPDFARFALRCSRALGLTDEGISALAFAEFNKSFQTVITDRITQMIFEVIRSRLQGIRDGEKYEFTCSEMLAEIKTKFADQVDDEDRQLTNRVIGKVLSKHLDEFGACFKTNPPRTLKGITRYGFTGFTDTFVNMSKEIGKTESDNEVMEPVEDDKNVDVLDLVARGF